MKNLLENLVKFHELKKQDYIRLLECSGNKEIADCLKKEAVKLRKKYYGNKVYTRGLIEFTNYCKNNCYYCGIRRSNQGVQRYRLTKEEILECCVNGYKLGFRTFVLQGGEDLWYTDEKLVDIISDIKQKFPDCALTLSIGEKSYDSYRKYKEAGADRYLLRHETACEEHYRMLHPEEMRLKERKTCLYNLKELGYQVGAGFMVGSPGQTLSNIAEDLIFLKELNPQMVGIGPFIPHSDTRFALEKAGSLNLTLFILSIIRIILPKVLLPATTALATIDSEGREKGILAGANVVMPNLSPLNNRKKYSLYDNKICMGEESAEGLQNLYKRVESIGYKLVNERGDALY